MSRLKARFDALKADNRAAFVTYIQAGDPNRDVSTAILAGLPGTGADIIELGMPFTDPAADGPAIDKAAQRALAAGACTKQTFEMVREFRTADDATPIVLMGYFNPVFHYGVEAFCKDAASVGVDGLIIVDLPPEEDTELLVPANANNIDIIRLATPTSDDDRLTTIVNGASGFVYYVAVAGVTGDKSATADNIGDAVARIKRHTNLPVAVGFGIKTPEQAAGVAARADAVVVGSAIVSLIEQGLEKQQPNADMIENILNFTQNLANGVRSGR